ncbi:alpha-amylase family glycosyl hydrolase [Nonomuraea sp. B19D2]|uniref:alpha-amylase family glycosyl hydrolase n=1 Tax=Nonomuraea sp. B19D2 TaxID=3159561 RepID=UPI0032D9DBEA
MDPLFGTLADFDHLLAEAHRRRLRLILDFVPNHTSIDHPWFVASRSSADDPMRDWYIWCDSAGGGLPNNRRGHRRARHSGTSRLLRPHEGRITVLSAVGYVSEADKLWRPIDDALAVPAPTNTGANYRTTTRHVTPKTTADLDSHARTM